MATVVNLHATYVTGGTSGRAVATGTPVSFNIASGATEYKTLEFQISTGSMTIGNGSASTMNYTSQTTDVYRLTIPPGVTMSFNLATSTTMIYNYTTWTTTL